MDAFLAELYNTDELVKQAAAEASTDTADDELEKQAADEFVQWAIENDIDLSKEADEDITAAFMTFRDGFMKQAAEGTPETDEQVDIEKFAEADAFGRIMAHAYVNELASIDKEAGVGAAKRGFFGKVTGKNLKTLKGYAEKNPAYKAIYEKALKETKGARTTAGFGGAAALGLGAQGAAGYGAYKGLKKMKEKKAAEEAYEQLVAERAQTLLKEAGYEAETEPTDEEKLAYQIEHDALKALEEAGYPVEWKSE